MDHVLGKFSPQIYALLRIVAGLLFAQHGAQKLLRRVRRGTARNTLVHRLRRRHDRARGWTPNRPGSFQRTGCVPCQRTNGGGVFHGPCEERSLPDPERRRARGALLLRLPLYSIAWLGDLERGRRPQGVRPETVRFFEGNSPQFRRRPPRRLKRGSPVRIETAVDVAQRKHVWPTSSGACRGMSIAVQDDVSEA